MKRPSISFPAKGLQPLQPMQPMPVPNNLTSKPPQPIPVTWQLWNGAWESYEKAGIQCVLLACLSVCLPACLAGCLSVFVCLFVCLFVCFYTRNLCTTPTLLLGDANADAGALFFCRCIAYYSEVKTTFHSRARLLSMNMKGFHQCQCHYPWYD